METARQIVPVIVIFALFLVALTATVAMAEKPAAIETSEGRFVKWNSVMPPEVEQAEDKVVIGWTLVPINAGIGGVRYMHIPVAIEVPDNLWDTFGGICDGMLWWWITDGRL